ncbi:MAG: trypsin, partial [Calditrichia bacterium]
SVNRFLIEGMARAGMGEAFIITRSNDAEKTANKFREYISSPVLTQITYDIDNFDVYDVEPASIPDVFAERPVLLFGKWRGSLSGKITVNGIVGQGKKYSKTITVSDYETADRNGALKYLWARHRIALLADYNQVNPNDERVKEITNLGLTYNLLTEYTSFIAADTQVRNQGGQVTTVQQPLPLPHGVSNFAVAARVGGSGIYKLKSGGPIQIAPGQEVLDVAAEESKSEEMQLAVRVEIQTKGFESLVSDLEKIIKKQAKAMEYCYKKSAVVGIPGKLRFQVTLNKQNQITEVKAIENSLKNKELANCLAMRIKTLKFVSPDKIKDVIFIIELRFVS